MRSALWCALLCGAIQGLAAQDQQVTFEETPPVSISGFAVAAAQYDRAPRTNTLTAGKVALSLFKPVGDAYFFGQLTTALDAGTSSTEIDNLIVSWTPHGADRWTLAVGRFDAPVGFERDDEPLNFLPTNSFTFTYARPVKLTGAIVRFTASPRLELDAGVANGWEETVDNNRGKTGLLRAQWVPVDGLTLGLSGLYGPERDSTDAHQRAFLGPDLTLERGPLILGAEASLGREQNPPGPALSWSGAAVTAFWKVGHSLGLAARYDRVSDPDGLVTGVAQTLESVTVGPMWFYRSAQEGIFSNIENTTFHLPQIALRTAVRFDHSTQPFFSNSTGGLSRDDTLAVIELLYLF